MVPRSGEAEEPAAVGVFCNPRTRRRMSALGQSRRFDDIGAMSAYPPISTEQRTFRDGRNVPITTVLHRRNTASYSPSDHPERGNRLPLEEGPLDCAAVGGAREAQPITARRRLRADGESQHFPARFLLPTACSPAIVLVFRLGHSPAILP